MTQRTERNVQSLENGLLDALEVGQKVIENMMQKTTRENVAGVTEIVVDSVITDKVTDAFMHLSTMIGNQVLKIADQIHHSKFLIQNSFVMLFLALYHKFCYDT